jgi:DNA replication ATP-dependent helicase Dna2
MDSEKPMNMADQIAALIDLVERERNAVLDLDAANSILSDTALVNMGYAIGGLQVTSHEEDIVILNCQNNESRFRPGDQLLFSCTGNRSFWGVLTKVLNGGRELHCRAGGKMPAVGSGPWLATENLVSLSNSIIKALEKLQPGGPGWGLVKRLFREEVPAIPGILPRIEIDSESLYSQLERDSAQGLDDSQLAVFKECLKMPALMGVQGPPGTGKTMLLSFVGEGLVRSGKKIVLLAPTHQAINNALSTIKRLFPGRQVIKVGDELRNESLDSSIPIVFKNKAIEEYPADTIFGMTFMAGLSRLMGVDRRPIDPNVVIIDEAGQLPLAQGVCAALCGAGSIFIFGDDRQMPPVFTGDVGDDEYAVSVFAQLRKSHPESISMLNITHRLNAELCRHIGDAFYPDASEPLKPSDRARNRYLEIEVKGEPDERIRQILEPANALVWANVVTDNNTQSNIMEAGVVSMLIEICLRSGMSPTEIAVVTPFRRQARMIHNALDKCFGKSIDLPIIDTVERVQGATVDLVVYSFCASQPDYVASLANFLFSPNRLNVAISRAKRKAIFVSSPDVFNVLPMEYRGIVGRNTCRKLVAGARKVYLTEG